MKDGHADVIVVGAGSLGANAALHLLGEGVGDVVLLDKDQPGYGTSNAGAGYVGHIAAGWTEDWGQAELAVETYGLEFFAMLSKDYDVRLRNNGHLYASRDEASWDHIAEFADSPHVPDARVVESAEITAMTDGYVHGEALYRGVFQPGGIQLSAGAAVRAVADRFVRQGGRLEDRTPATGLIVEGGRVTGVSTTRGDFYADRVVVAAGAWTNQFLAPYVFLPQVPLLLSRMRTSSLGVPSTMPALNLAGYSDHGRGILWIREDEGGFNFGMPGAPAEPRTMFASNPVPERFDQVPVDGVVAAREAAKNALEVIPALLDGSYSIANGTTCATPDNRALIGDLEDLPGLFVIAGCNGGGVQHGPGWGKVAAELIAHGTSTFPDVAGWRPNRFPRKFVDGADVLANLKPNRRAVSHAE